MEVIKISKTAIATDFTQCNSLKEIIAKLEDQLSQKGRVICRVHVNGMPLTEDDEQRFAESKLAEISDIEVESEEIEHLVASSMKSLVSFIEELKEDCVQTAEKIRASKSPKNENLVSGVFKNVQWIISALQALRPQLDPVADDFAERWLTNETHMVHTARELAAAVDSDDYMLLADVLEYELYNSLDKWRETLRLYPTAALT